MVIVLVEVIVVVEVTSVEITNSSCKGGSRSSIKSAEGVVDVTKIL